MNIELLENFPCDNANSLKCKKNEVNDKMIIQIIINKNRLKKIYNEKIYLSKKIKYIY